MLKEPTPDEQSDIWDTLSPEAREALGNLALAYGMDSCQVALVLTIRILYWITEQIADGYDIGVEKEGDFQVALLPSQPNIEIWNKGKIYLN
jgi:hypothetical protein